MDRVNAGSRKKRPAIRIWTRWIFFLCATVLNLWLVYSFVPPESQKNALVFLAAVVALTGFIVLRSQREARRNLLLILRKVKIPGWGAPELLDDGSSQGAADKAGSENLGVWRRDGHEIWLQRRLPKQGMGHPTTVITASLRPSFDGNVLVSRTILPSELTSFLNSGGGRLDADMRFIKSFSVQAVPPSAGDTLLDTATWKAIGTLASLEDPLHQFFVGWRNHTMVVSLDGDIEDAATAETFLKTAFKIIDRLIDLGLRAEKPVISSFSRRILLVPPAASVMATAGLMKTHHVGSVLVSQDGRTPLGIFTETDACRRVVAEGRDAAATPVADVMSGRLVSIAGSDPIGRAYGVMASGRLRHVPVMEGQAVVGMVSLTDLFRRLCRKWEESGGAARLGPGCTCEVFAGEVAAVAPNATVAEAAGVMKSRGVGAVLVRGGEGGSPLQGIVTERDLCRRVVAAGLDGRGTPVSAVATAKVSCLEASDPLEKAIRLLGTGDFRHIPVRDKAGVVGMVSVVDLVRLLAQSVAAD